MGSPPKKLPHMNRKTLHMAYAYVYIRDCRTSDALLYYLIDAILAVYHSTCQE